MQLYYALVQQDAGSAFGIHFPDLPGCFSAADEEADVLAQAQEALALYATGVDVLPVARSIHDLTSDVEVKAVLADGGFFIGVPLVAGQRKARYNLMIEPTLVAGVDNFARAAGVSRSEFVSNTLQQRLAKEFGVVVEKRQIRIVGSNSGSTSSTKAASAAGKVLASTSATKAQKSVAASALTQKGSTEKTSAKVASAASKILQSKPAAKAAKSAAASALTQKTKKA